MSYLINILSICFYLSIILALAQAGLVVSNPAYDPNELPFYASIRKSDNEKLCSGAIVSNKHVLTTAHCLDSKYNDRLRIATGYTKKSNVFETLHEVDSIQFHPKYTKSIDPETNRLNDIAIIKIKGLIILGKYQKLIQLPWMNIENKDFDSMKALDNNNNCKDKISDIVADDLFCAYQKPGIHKRPVFSGSPFIVKGKLAGLTLTSRPYTTGEPELYVNVFKHLDFIKSCMFITPIKRKA